VGFFFRRKYLFPVACSEAFSFPFVASRFDVKYKESTITGVFYLPATKFTSSRVIPFSGIRFLSFAPSTLPVFFVKRRLHVFPSDFDQSVAIWLLRRSLRLSSIRRPNVTQSQLRPLPRHSFFPPPIIRDKVPQKVRGFREMFRPFNSFFPRLSLGRPPSREGSVPCKGLFKRHCRSGRREGFFFFFFEVIFKPLRRRSS